MYSASTATLKLAKGDNAHTAKLRYSPGAVHIQVRAGGEPVSDATVRFAGPELHHPLSVDGGGEAWTELAAGSWQALVASPGRIADGLTFTFKIRKGINRNYCNFLHSWSLTE